VTKKCSNNHTRNSGLPRPPVLAASLMVMAEATVAQPSRSDAIGALAANVTTWTIIGRRGVCVSGLQANSSAPHVATYTNGVVQRS
jgi:hypothetical protein